MSESPTPSSSALRTGAEERPLVLVVLPRIVDLVVQQDLSLAPLLFSQRRTSYALRRERLMEILDLDEIGLDEHVRLPREVVLVAQPRQLRLGGRGSVAREGRTWRLAASALAILRLRQAREEGRLTMSQVHLRITLIGRENFIEIESVLHRELRLFEDDDLVRIYGEFITLHAELRTFSPQALDSYFPSLAGRHEEIASLGSRDLSWESILQAVRPEGLALDDVRLPSEGSAAAAEDEALIQPLPPLRPSAKRYRQLTGWAKAALGRGNAVVAAILYRRASRLAPDQVRCERSEGEAHRVIDGLVRRLQRALAFDEARAEVWRQALLDLFYHSSRGFWNTNKRLLYDLQKVCVDYEHESHTVDLFGFIRSLGRRPIRRALPNQREVLMSKHLRSAASRLAKARVTSTQRNALSVLLREAAASAEQQLRRRLRPRIARSLNEDGLRPENLPERVARGKLIEELLDCIVRRGHLNMGDVRDAISRSQLKLSDLTLRELWAGDAILRADRRLDRLLEGVYRRGEFYLRGLQRLSSLGFGRAPGRFLIQYLVVPFGGAFLLLEAIRIVWEKISDHKTFLSTSTEVPDRLWEVLQVPAGWGFASVPHIIPAVLVVGVFLLGLIHAPGFRSFVWAVTQTVFRCFKHVIIDFPRWFMSLSWARLILRSRVAKVLRRYLVTPLIPAAILYGVAVLLVEFKNRYTALTAFVLIFAAFNFFLNSSLGRRFEERVGAWAARVWYSFRVQIIRSLFEAVMTLFRRLMEWTERILYAMDEWLLFKTGENRLTFWIKGILGSIWSVVAYVVRFCITLLVEPQINPIKHFPVVTVSHKILLPSQPFLASTLVPALGTTMANAVAGAIVTLAPGIAGFLVWELKSNWNLYRANRDPVLKPVAVGFHGESLPRLLRPGFHSGVLGKLYGKMRRTERQADSLRRGQALAQAREKLHHFEVAVRHFVERELFALVRSSPTLGDLRLDLAEVRLLPNAIHLQIGARGRSVEGAGNAGPLHLLFQAHRDWLVVKVIDPGWVRTLSSPQQETMSAALTGFYKWSGVELVDEQIRQTLAVRRLVYHLRLGEMEAWADEGRSEAVVYGLRTWGTIRPHPSSRARGLGFVPVARKQLLFSERDVSWEEWVAYWEGQTSSLAPGDPAMPSGELLPPAGSPVQAALPPRRGISLRRD